MSKSLERNKRYSHQFCRYARKLLLGLGGHIVAGRIELEEAGQTHVFGELSDAYPEPGRLKIHHERFYVRALSGGMLGISESYMDGDWTTDDLPRLLRVVMANESLYVHLERKLGVVMRPLHKVAHWLKRNTEQGSKRNILAHYDLGNEFFAHFLDETMAYSCAFFHKPDASLEEASREKFDMLCRKLHLSPEDHLLEIGTGWGGLAMHAAERYGCRVTTTTISDEQRKWAIDAVKARGLDDRITVLGQDYRKLDGQYDKLVSVEMIEAVGLEYLPVFFQCCHRLLKPHGLMALQAITVPNRWHRGGKSRPTFINQYVFPGSSLVPEHAMYASIKDGTDFDLVHKEDMTAHYAKTLQIWRDRFMGKLEDIRKFWPEETFIKTWDLYFASCEAGFTERQIGVGQYVFARPAARLPMPYEVGH